MEYKKLCKTCGKVYCYTDEDLKNNKQNAAMSAISAIGGLASVFGGTIFHTAHLSNQTDKYSDKVVDYTKCPYCNSRNVVTVLDEEYAKIAKNMGPGIASSKKVEVSANATPESLIKRAELFLEDGAWDYADAYADSCLDAEPENAYAYVCKLMAELRVKKFDELEDCRKPFDDKDNYKKAVRFANEELKVKLNGYIVHINERNKNEELTRAYISASKQMDAAKTEEEFMAAAEVFATIPEFKDSDEKQKFCYVKAEEVRKNTIYNDAKTKMESGIVSNMEEAITLFESIPNWEDSEMHINCCKEKIEKQKNKNRRDKKNIIIVSLSVIVILGFVIILNNVIIPNNKINAAREKYVEDIGALRVGDVYQFGTYEQDNNVANGKEDIDWLVLEKQNNKVLLISKHALEYKQYHTDRNMIDWETSALRDWLNNEFINSAFSEDEKLVIPIVKINKHIENEHENSASKSEIQDKIFLLSSLEVKKYFDSGTSLECNPTEYAFANATNTKIGNENCWWWLRTSLEKESLYFGHAHNDDGKIKILYTISDFDGCAVRPALWIDLN